jgi:threonine dehydrogenase-like Zn-dependent dehydrogenase
MAASPASKGFDYVVECAGVPSTVPEGFSYLARGGCFVGLGHFSDAGSVEINPYQHVLSRDARMVSSSSYTPDSLGRAFTTVEVLGPLADSVVNHRPPIDRAYDVVDALQPSSRWQLNGVQIGKIVIDPWLSA